MPPAVETIQAFVVPVVMISANGLLCLAFYSRMSAIVNRCRTINKERFDLLAGLAAAKPEPEDAPANGHLHKRIEILDQLGHQLFQRARWIRGTLLCLLISVLSMLACSLTLGLSMLAGGLVWAALALFVGGTVAMMVGIVLAIQELRTALHPVAFEHEEMERSLHFRDLSPKDE
jgi:hypothetical protein